MLLVGYYRIWFSKPENKPRTIPVPDPGSRKKLQARSLSPACRKSCRLEKAGVKRYACLFTAMGNHYSQMYFTPICALEDSLN